MQFDKKYFSTIAITAVVVAGIAVVVDRQYLQYQEKPQVAAEHRYQDPKSGISFVVPSNWAVGTDEEGNLYAYGSVPYRTVTFRTFDNKISWQNQINAFSEPNTDTLIKKENITLDGKPTIMMVFERRIAGRVMLKYVEYFVNAGTTFYEISGTNPDAADVVSIIQSIKF